MQGTHKETSLRGGNGKSSGLEYRGLPALSTVKDDAKKNPLTSLLIGLTHWVLPVDQALD
jgi:hypothetical protein